MRTLSLFLLLAYGLNAQTPVTIHVDAAQKLGRYKPIYGYFGYDEPNYTYTKNGRKLIGELSHLSATPVYIRTHFMLTTGDGKAGLKWGSTNAYTEDASGKAVYDWTIADRIFDTYLEAGAKPFVEIGFMPQALSSKPEPYRPTWIPGDKNPEYYIGWAYPPRDFKKWGELVYRWTRHAVEKYGRAEVATWYWEVWNEPDIQYWRGTPEEYNGLYDYAVDGVRRALPEARVGGPATTSPSGDKAGAFLRQFLEHCVSGKNAATGKTGAPLDFVTYHAKGRPTKVDEHVRMGIAKEADDVEHGMQILTAFPKFRDLPIILSEADPEGCAACSARVYPQNAYRNGSLFPAYTAVMIKNIFELADKHKANIEGMLTWAFEFEDQPYFDGFRTLATNGIDKPVLNVFRMAGMMRGDRVKTESSGGITTAAMIANGVRREPDIDAMAVRGEHELSVLAWNYHDDDVAGPEAKVELKVAGLPKRVQMKHFRIDDTHSNAWTAWKKMGSPAQPDTAQYAALEAAGQLESMESPRYVDSAAPVTITLPRQGVSLIQFSW